MAIYQIQLEGTLDESWSAWFSGFQMQNKEDENGRTLTTLTGPAPDQAALRGLVNKIWDLNLILVSIERIDNRTKQQDFDVGARTSWG